MPASHEERGSLVHEAGIQVEDKPEVGYVGLTDGAPKRRFVVSNPHLRECMGEFLGTFTMMVFGVGVNNQVTVSELNNGIYLSITIGWGVAVFFGIQACGGVSGAHLNPAVTLSMAAYNRLAWRKVPGYILAQMVSSFLACCCVYFIYQQHYDVVDPDRTFTRGTYATYPHENISNTTAFYTEFVATALLMAGIFAIGDSKNSPAGPGNGPLHVMLLIWAIGIALGMNSGYALNPARDFPPRLFTSMAGWGGEVFQIRNYWWIPCVAPILGGLFGSFIYDVFVERHHPVTPEK